MSIADLSQTPINVDAIPQAMRDRPQWVNWKYEQRGGGKPTKIPVTIGGYNAKTDTPSDWYTFDDVCEAMHKFAGIGYVFNERCPFLGGDLDDCFASPGELKPWAEKIMEQFAGTYSEVSPSGNGIRFFCRAKNPMENGRKVIVGDNDGAIEIYDRGRFFTVTTNAWDDSGATDKQFEVDALAAEYFSKQDAKPKPIAAGPPNAEASDKVSRASKYLATMDVTQCGTKSCHDRTMRAACTLVIGFDLEPETAYHLLWTQYAPRGTHRWTEQEIRHKIESAIAEPGERGHILRKQRASAKEQFPNVDISGFGEGEAVGSAQDKMGSEEPDLPAATEQPPTTSALVYLRRVMGKLRAGEGDELFNAGAPFVDFECGPGLLVMVAGVPGGGKTCMINQLGMQALANHPELQLTIANAETDFERLLKRELTRRTGVPARALRFADLSPTQLATVEQAAADLEPLMSRVDALDPPYTLQAIERLQNAAPGLLILDYLQLFSPNDKEPRIGANAVAKVLRSLCRQGWGVLALSATTRTRGKNGSTHDSDNLTMASLRESGDLEFQSDAIYLLRDKGPATPGDDRVLVIELDCVKNRNGEVGSRPVIFDKPKQEFRLPDSSMLSAVDISHLTNEPFGEGGEFDDWNAGGGDDPFGGDA